MKAVAAILICLVFYAAGYCMSYLVEQGRQTGKLPTSSSDKPSKNLTLSLLSAEVKQSLRWIPGAKDLVPFGDRKFVVKVKLSNYSTTKKIDGELFREYHLTDGAGNIYKHDSSSTMTPKGALYPGESAEGIIWFERPVKDQDLKLSIDTADGRLSMFIAATVIDWK